MVGAMRSEVLTNQLDAELKVREEKEVCVNKLVSQDVTGCEGSGGVGVQVGWCHGGQWQAASRHMPMWVV